MTVLITGATGFMGSHLAHFIADDEVVALTRDVIPSEWLKEALCDAIKVRGDLGDYRFLARVINQYEVTKVYHLAAVANVKIAHRNPIGVYETNIMGTVNVLEACRQMGISKVLVMTTDKIFGDKMNAEANDPVKAHEPYTTSKSCVDLISRSYEITYGMKVLRIRSCNVYGYDWNNRLIPNTIRKCLRGERPIIFEGEYDTLRQYLYVQDYVEAIYFLMEYQNSGAFNICTKELLNQKDVVKKILTFFPTLKPTYIARDGPLEIVKQSLKLTECGWKPRFSFIEGITETIDKYRKYGC